MNFLNNKKIIVGIILLLIVVSYFFDKGLFIGLSLLVILSGITFFVFNWLGLKDKKVYSLFLVVLAIHLSATLFMHYANFQPFSGQGGDYLTYQKSAVEASQCLKQGIFSVKSIVLKYPDFFVGHCYPIIVGSIYALTIPEEIIGLMLNVWLVAVSIVFVYLIILEIGGSAKNAFIIGLVTAIYPSYIFNSGLLLKDALEIFFVLMGMLLLIKVIKKFTWYNFSFLFLAVFCVTHFRFYIGYALIITFLLSWFLFSKMDFKKKMVYGIMFIIIFGFIPEFAAGQGYGGFNSFETYLNKEMVYFYRQSAYNAEYYKFPVVTDVSVSANPASVVSYSTTGFDSSFTTGHGPLSYVRSFIYVLLGPFPWQIKNLRQLFALFETIPWYLLLFFVVDGMILAYKKRIYEIAPLLMFSFIVMVIIAIFDNNFGLIVRIRIPAFISLLCIASLGFNDSNIIYRKINIFCEKFIFKKELFAGKNEQS